MSLPDLPAPLAGPVPGRESPHSWRGIMIDSARTRFPVAAILQVIELAARYGFNRLHWHLTDDQGWRFDVPGYPRLIEVAAALPRGRFDEYASLLGDTRERALAEAERKWTSGHYTDEEIRQVVAHAAQHGITVVPEVDLPGHMAAAIAAYPELGRPAGIPLPEGSMREHMWWPARDDLLWPTDAAADFVTAALRHISELFPGPHVHIGGDECAYRQWESDPEIGQWLARRGVEQARDLQGWFIDVASRALSDAGRRVIMWDEACEISDADDALIIAWAEQPGMERVMRATQDFVFADARTLYLNRIDPAAAQPQKGMTPGISVHDILSASWDEARDPRCIGIQACVWSEFVLDADDLLSMLLPRLIAVAERIWNPTVDIADASARISREHELLRAAGALNPLEGTA